jgi:ABC-type antimicrobial peptide transport system permease subunit
MANSRSWTSLRLPDEPKQRNRMVSFHEVSAGYFDVLGIPIVEGRNFTREDFGRRVVILNQTAAKSLWPGAAAVGKMITSNSEQWEVVGVTKDVYTTDFNAIPPTMYWPMSGRFDIPQVLVRGGAAAVSQVAAIVTHIDPKARVRAIPLSENFRAQLEPARYGAALAGGLGLLALTLASIGMSGVFAYVVRQRTREIGVRMALGASQTQVVKLVLTSNLRALAVGLGIGLAGAVGVSRLLIHQINQVSTLDPVAYGGVFVLLSLAAVAAGAMPARRAAHVDPVRALRWE